MNRKVVLVGALVLAAAGGVAWWATRARNEPSSSPAVDDPGAAPRPGLAVAPPRGAARAGDAARPPGSFFDPAAAISGRVVSAAGGAPVAGASVEATVESAFSADDGTTSAYQGRVPTDASGAFSLALPPGAASLVATARGFVEAGLDLTADAPRSHVEIRLARTATVLGTVMTAGGRPAAGAKVRVRSSGAYLETVADEDGRYRVPDVPPGEVRASVFGGGWVQDGSPDAPNPVVTVEPGASVEITLRAVRPARADGVVVDAAGSPVPGATVDRRPTAGIDSDRQPYADREKRSLTVEQDGTFAFDELVPGATYVFGASAEGFARGEAEPWVASSDAPAHVRILLKAARWLVVTVRDAATGAPIEGASAYAHASGSWHGSFSGETGRDGTARLGPFPAGEGLELYASASARDYYDDSEDLEAAIESAENRVESTDRPGDLAKEIRLTRGLTVAGRLVMPAGPVPERLQVNLGVRVEGRGESIYYRSDLGDVTASRDDPAGPYSFRFGGVRPGTYRLWIHPEESERRFEGSMHVAAGSVGVTLRVVAEEPILLVHVVDERGKPVDGGGAYLWDPSSKGESVTNAPVREGTARFWPNDLASVQGLWLEATGDIGDGAGGGLGIARLGPLAAGTREATLRLGPSKRIEGRVVTADGHGVGGVGVSALSVPSEADPLGMAHAGHAQTAPDGSFSISGLGDAEYRVGLSHERDDYFLREPATARGGATGVRLVVVPALSARITVLDSSGRPLEGASVWATEPGDGGRARGGTTDTAGIVVLKGFDPALTWNLSVSPPKERSDASQLARERWEPRDETIRLAPGFTVTGHVVDAAGRPLAGAYVSAEAGYYAVTEPDGSFRIDSLPGGDVHLTVLLDDDSNDEPPLADIVVAAGTRDVRLVARSRNRSRPSLVVRVPNLPPGARLDKMQLFDQPPSQEWPHHASPKTNGKEATFTGLREGVSYTLWWPIPKFGLVAYVPDVKAGCTIDVPLLPSKSLTGTVRIPPGGEEARVVVHLGHAEAEAWTAEDGLFQIEGLPEGTFSVSALSSTGFAGVPYEGTIVATAGTDVEITLHKK